MEEKIEITETETQMEDGSISVHCSALGPQGEHVTMAYVVGVPTLALAPELRALVIQQHQNHTRAAIEERVRELRATPALEVVPPLPAIEIPPLAGRATRDISPVPFMPYTADIAGDIGNGTPTSGFTDFAICNDPVCPALEHPEDLHSHPVTAPKLPE